MSTIKSLATRRRNAQEATKVEIASCELAFATKLKSIWRVNQFVLAGGAPKTRDFLSDAPPTQELLRFLEANDITKGHHFDEGTLPTLFNDAEKTTAQPSEQSALRIPSPSLAPSPSSSVSNSANRLPSSQEPKSPSPPSRKADRALTSITTEAATTTPPRSPTSLVESRRDNDKDSLETSRKTPDPTLALSTAKENPKETGRSLTPKVKERPARTIHLPPKEVVAKHLEEHGQEVESARLREGREEENHGFPTAVPISNADAGSSPSSTTGAYSTSTPKPLQQSPDTSPDTEYATGAVRLPDANTLDDTLDVVKDGLAEEAGTGIGLADGTLVTPEAQLRLEEEQATKLAQQSSRPIDTATPKTSELFAGSDHMALPENIPNEEGRAKEILGEGASGAVLVPHALSGERSTPFKTPKRPSVNTNTSEFDIHMQDLTDFGDISLGDITPASATRQTPTEPPTRRMTTRVASGAIRQKSVSEILGETPKPSAVQSSRAGSQNQISASPFTMRETATTPTEEKSRHSMVVFSKKDKSVSPIRGSRYEPDGYLALRGASDDPEKDYLRPLFLHQAYLPPRATALGDLIGEAKKTLSTTNMYSNMREAQDYRILRRIYQLQNANKWSLRQMAKFPDPPAPLSHQDHLLAEMKWMRTDFREERTWKMAGARRLAESCARYFAATEEVKAQMRTKAKIPARRRPGQEMLEEPPELIHSASTESGDSLPDEEIPDSTAVSTVAPTALFSLGYDDIVFELDLTPAGEGILNELPLYDTKPAQPSPFHISAGSTNLLIPVSKYSSGKLVPKPSALSRKRSRYDYESEVDESGTTTPPTPKRRASEVSLFHSPARLSPRHKELPPEETDVALFNPLNRHIRDRLHANHAFRPPSEFQMPSTSFFEHRIASQWTWDEDQKLRVCVKKFSYNWSLIAMELQAFSQPSMFIAASERRTPWECFERWYQLEGLPNDMDKTQYFRTYRSRIEAANRTVAALQQAQQNQGQTPGAAQPLRRRPSTQPYRVERRRDSRYINMVDAIRKLARKRETAAHRQQESAKAAALRRQHNEATQTRNTGIHTPQEFSRMKHERELKIQERQEIYRQQLMQQQQQRNAQMQRVQMQGQQQGIASTSGQPPQRNGTPNGTQGPSPPTQMTNGQSTGGVPARHPSQNMMQNGMSNGNMNGVSMSMPQAQMQALGQQRMATHDGQANMRMQIAAQQRAAQQFQMQQQTQQPNNLAAAHFNAPNGNMQTPQMLAALAASRGNGTPNSMSGSPGNSTSPRGMYPGQNPLGQQPQQLSNTPAIISHQQQVAQQFPHFTPEQIQKLANERLKGQMARMQANALSAASGSPVPNMPSMNQAMSNPYHTNGIPGSHSPTQYQQQLRLMQQQQQQGGRLSGSPSMSNARPVSRSATPQDPQGLHHQRASSGPGMPS